LIRHELCTPTVQPKNNARARTSFLRPQEVNFLGLLAGRLRLDPASSKNFFVIGFSKCKNFFAVGFSNRKNFFVLTL